METNFAWHRFDVAGPKATTFWFKIDCVFLSGKNKTWSSDWKHVVESRAMEPEPKQFWMTGTEASILGSGYKALVCGASCATQCFQWIKSFWSRSHKLLDAGAENLCSGPVFTGVGDQCNLTEHSYNTVRVRPTVTVYEYHATRIGTLAHTFWVVVSFPEVYSTVEAGRTRVGLSGYILTD